jgi:hypothetical protein
MTSNDRSGAGGKFRILLAYIGIGVATFVVAGAWVFAGLKIWGK